MCAVSFFLFAPPCRFSSRVCSISTTFRIRSFTKLQCRPRHLHLHLHLHRYHLLSLPSFSSQIHSLAKPINMAAPEAGNELPKQKAAGNPYEEALDALSSLITKRTRADKSNKGDRFDFLFDYLKILDLEVEISKMKIIHVAGTKGKILDLEVEISKMKIIHVAGTKGKGSTCTFTESILRNYGFRTGLFTSPHLIDIRERFRLDGVDISEEKFLSYFWWCYNRLKERTNEETPMPTYFRFLALLAFKIFSAEKVDVALLEVGLGGKFDATNVVQEPVVCGISSLGYDHMEILGDTLGKIAGEKAGIFKRGVPAISVPQPDEAMRVLEERASELDVNLRVVQPLNETFLGGQKLGLDGEHQYLNAGLAVALASTWLQRTGNLETPCLNQTSTLPEEFIKGLATARLQGRAQVVPDQFVESGNPEDLVFYLDGAHSPESMEACAKWFSLAVKDRQSETLKTSANDSSGHPHDYKETKHDERSRISCQQAGNKASYTVLLFNCMSVRDPNLLLPHLRNTCENYDVHFKKALFVPNMSVYNKVGTHTLPETDSQVNLSWQLALQNVWESLAKGDRGGEDMNNAEDRGGSTDRNSETSAVFSSLPLAIKWLRDSVNQAGSSVRFQVLVTGSLHLVGDVLRLVRK